MIVSVTEELLPPPTTLVETTGKEVVVGPSKVIVSVAELFPPPTVLVVITDAVPVAVALPLEGELAVVIDTEETLSCCGAAYATATSARTASCLENIASAFKV